jgi:hypothetical protein
MKTTKYTSTNIHRVQQSKDRLNYSLHDFFSLKQIR